MLYLELSKEQVEDEISKIRHFISKEMRGREQVVVAVSGGLDSDVVVRLAKEVPAIKKMKLFFVHQDDMDIEHLYNARALAEDIGEKLIEISLKDEPFDIITKLKNSDSDEIYYVKGLDAMRMKCSLRTCILSTYQDHGYIVLGTGNRTEFETGFYLPFGDGISHICPIRHLYKSQVRQLALSLNTLEKVISQPASAGFWKGEEDLEDLSWWLFNEKPITDELNTNADEDAIVENIRSQLTTENVDQILFGIFQKIDINNISSITGVTSDVIDRFKKLVTASSEFKNRGYNKHLPNTV
jgi:NAD+ synthase